MAENLESIGRFADALAGVDEVDGDALLEAIVNAGFRDGAGLPVALVVDEATEPAA